MPEIDRIREFSLLVEAVNGCRLCAGLQDRHRLLSEKNGDLRSSIVFVGEAPGRLGAERTLIPFCGDQAGKNFERLLAAAGLNRAELFITNAVLCNPRDENGHNRPPTIGEVRNCSPYLGRVLEIVQPKLVVTLGRWALRAFSDFDAEAPQPIDLRHNVGKPISLSRWVILPLYHPGPRATIHRSRMVQTEDFRLLGLLARSFASAEDRVTGHNA